MRGLLKLIILIFVFMVIYSIYQNYQAKRPWTLPYLKSSFVDTSVVVKDQAVVVSDLAGRESSAVIAEIGTRSLREPILDAIKNTLYAHFIKVPEDKARALKTTWCQDVLVSPSPSPLFTK